MYPCEVVRRVSRPRSSWRLPARARVRPSWLGRTPAPAGRVAAWQRRAQRAEPTRVARVLEMPEAAAPAAMRPAMRPAARAAARGAAPEPVAPAVALAPGRQVV